MAIIKCKMCGGDLNIVEDSSVCECEYCGTRQTVPKVDDEKKLKLFSRAGKLLRGCEFDKAAGVFESIVADFPEEAEAYWGLILCKFGIEYVDDPATGKKIPTCHRSSFESVEDDTNFELACENADAVARRVYREEARQIEELRRRILEVSGKEEPYDVFISYKELDEDGERTPDSVIAQDIYRALTKEGYRVFFSRISLEGKLGVEYEPYIFAALNSAKVMIVVGTDYEYYDAVWVKNEWSRFLKLIASGQQKTLIPVYKDMDPYDMPKELRSLAAQNMGKIGAMQDLLHGVEKIVGKKTIPESMHQFSVYGSIPNITALLGRGNLSLEDGNWKKAKEIFDQILNIDYQNSDAYLGLAMAENRLSTQEELRLSYIKANSPLRQSNNPNLKRARQFSSEIATWLSQLDEEGRQADQKKAEAYEREENEKREKQTANSQSLKLIRDRNRIASRMIAAGNAHSVGLRADGTAVAVGSNSNHIRQFCNQCKVFDWSNVVAVAAGDYHTVGLKADGTVFAVGYNPFKQCEVSAWTDIVAVAAGRCHTVGLKADGTIVTMGWNEHRQCEVSAWTDIVAVAAGERHTVGLKADGTVVAVGSNEYKQCEVSNWTEIVAVTAGTGHTVGLKANGTVVAVGANNYKQCEVSSWTDIVAVAAGTGHTVGLKADGSMVAVGTNNVNQCEVSGWTKIVAVVAGAGHTLGLKENGSVLAAGKNDYGQCEVSGWSLFNSVETIEVERKAAEADVIAADEKDKAESLIAAKRAEVECRAAEERAEAARRAEAERARELRSAREKALKEEKAHLNMEMANLHGLFTGKRRKEIETRLAAIESELKKLG